MTKEIFSPRYVRLLAQEMRRNPTPTEKMLWQKLRRGNLNGIGFKQQEPIGRYIVDFLAPRLNRVLKYSRERAHGAFSGGGKARQGVDVVHRRRRRNEAAA